MDEFCDDGNFNNTDGCNNAFTINSRWNCEQASGGGIEPWSICAPLCGDGELIENESCDGLGHHVEGCISCMKESGYNCDNSGLPSDPSVCTT